MERDSFYVMGCVCRIVLKYIGLLSQSKNSNDSHIMSVTILVQAETSILVVSHVFLIMRLPPSSRQIEASNLDCKRIGVYDRWTCLTTGVAVINNCCTHPSWCQLCVAKSGSQMANAARVARGTLNEKAWQRQCSGGRSELLGIPNDGFGRQIYWEVVVDDAQAYPELLVRFKYD